MLHQNLELKARCDDLIGAAEKVVRLGAVMAAYENQRDTFFHAREGRLKLREITRWRGGVSNDAPPDEQHAELIWYFRPDHLEIRPSAYHLVAAPDPAGLIAALTAANGVRGVVSKGRAIFLWRGVRIHLDMVVGLGRFVEFEAVLGPDLDPDTAAAYLTTLRETLDLADDDRIASAYADLLGL